ncbi:AAA family ATPase [Flavobacterium gyeonganense]|uniref:AAA family ATPase n=1 Tax=Flavobacterium gyeonganense TaxID=1310418 RepID=A0ABV5H9A2_9FLAO|nr:AAA family ATPase [Flavobacterium gyeonganense]
MIIDFLKGSALVAFVVGFWDKIKTVIWIIISTFIQKIEIKSEDTHDAIVAYLITNYKKISSYDRVYGSQYESYRNGKYGLVPYEKYGVKSIIFLTEKKFLKLFRLPFYFTHTNPHTEIGNDNNPHSISETDKTYSYIFCLRFTVNFDEIVTKSIIGRNNVSWNIDEKEENSNRFNIYYFPEREYGGSERHGHNSGYAWYKQNQYRILGVTQDELGRERKSNGKALENLFFPKKIKNLIDIIGLWVKSQNWYKEKGIPWKRGWLLYGPPGTGKTALARAFAEDLDMPIYFFSIGQLSNNEFVKSWQSMQLNVPCIALIEDIDNVFDKRKNIAQNSMVLSGLLQNSDDGANTENQSMKMPLTFDTLLNCIDGVDKSEGVFTIITTNDITKIDSAIGVPQTLDDGTLNFVSTRPGRIDKAIELTYMERENKIEMANKILGDFNDELEKVLEYIRTETQETPAQFQEYCSQIALQEYWKINQ